VAERSRVLFPQADFTVRDLVRVYEGLASVLLPHLRCRPVSFRRYPDDIHGESYWEKDAPGFTPQWVKTVAVPRVADRSEIRYILVEDARTLSWAASVGCVEIHPFLHCYSEINQPTSIVFDLDPGEGASLHECAISALLLRDYFEPLGLRVFPKVSGAKGIQVYLPLNTPAHYSATQMFAKRVAEHIAQQNSRLITAENSKALRGKRVLIDWAQNSQLKSNVAVYSVRASGERPYVSVPLTWNEVLESMGTDDLEPLRFTPDLAIARIGKRGDLFEQVLTLRQELPENLLRDWRIIEKPRNLVSFNRPRRSDKGASLRSSGQGGRKLFFVDRTKKRNGESELALQFGEEFRSWRLAGIPGSATQVSAVETNESTLSHFEGGDWERGVYEVIEGSYRKGMLRLFFSGAPITGEWTLSRTADKWILQKLHSGPTNGVGVGGRERERQNKIPIHSQAAGIAGAVDLSTLAEGRPSFIEPMEADEVDNPQELPNHRGEWAYEVKWDGYRAIAVKSAGAVRIYGRSGKLLDNCRHEHLDEALKNSGFGDGVIDGEIVAFKNGIASFQTLQNSRRNQASVLFIVFDVLNYSGRDLTSLSYMDRRKVLRTVQPLLPQLFPISEPLEGNVQEIIKAFELKNIEGVVAKRRNSYYRPGKRSHDWVKYWIGELGEFWIGGYMPGKDPYFEALAVGEYINGDLIYREQIRHGFTVSDKQDILARIKGDRIPRCPFANLPQRKRRGSVDAVKMEQYVWVEPKICCLMRYKERTAAGEVREHGTFVRLADGIAA
jgi:bifunctional non-homologous end joining protein LigD